MVMGAWNADYTTLLNSCNIPSLQSRRSQLKLFLYKIICVEILFPDPLIESRNTSIYLRNNNPHHFVRQP